MSVKLGTAERFVEDLDERKEVQQEQPHPRDGARQSVRLDRFGDRLERVERRLEIADGL